MICEHGTLQGYVKIVLHQPHSHGCTGMLGGMTVHFKNHSYAACNSFSADKPPHRISLSQNQEESKWGVTVY
jgi:hypothetical protein